MSQGLETIISLYVQVVADAKQLPWKISPGRANHENNRIGIKVAFFVFVYVLLFFFHTRVSVRPGDVPSQSCSKLLCCSGSAFQGLAAAEADVSVHAPPWGTSLTQ